MSWTLLSRLTGQVRSIFLVAAIGATGAVADAFDVANNIPVSLNLILTAGIFNAILVPQIVKSRKYKDADERIGKLLTFATTLIFGITLILTLLAGVLIVLIASDTWTAEQKGLAVTFGFWCMPQIFFYGMYTLFGQVLASKEKFGIYGFAPVINNIISIIFLSAFIVLSGGFGHTVNHIGDISGVQIVLLGLGSTLGIALQAAILFIPLKSAGFKFVPTFSLRGFGLRKISNLAFWSFAMMLLDEIAALYCINVASGAPDAAKTRGMSEGILSVAGNAAWTNAITINTVANSLITITIMTTLFTKISNFAAQDDRKGVAKEVVKGTNMIIFLITFFTVAIVVLAVPTVRTLIPSVTSQAAIAIVSGLIPLTLSTMLSSIGQMVSRAFFAFEKQALLFRLDVPRQIILALGAFISMQILPPSNWVEGIGISTIIAVVVYIPVMLHSLKKHVLKGEIKIRPIVQNLVKCTLSAMISAVVGFLTLAALGMNAKILSEASWTTNCLTFVAMSCEILVVYFVICKVFKVPETKIVIARLKQTLPSIKK